MGLGNALAAQLLSKLAGKKLSVDPRELVLSDKDFVQKDGTLITDVSEYGAVAKPVTSLQWLWKKAKSEWQ
jgi:hypothetical protein